jgi:hypothetical protein
MASEIAASGRPHLIGASMPSGVVLKTSLHEGDSIANEIAASEHMYLVGMRLITYLRDAHSKYITLYHSLSNLETLRSNPY